MGPAYRTMGPVNRRHAFLSRGLGAYLAIVGLLAAVIVAVPLAAPVAPAAANVDFNPGYIISDEKFFDATTMDEGAIASFLHREGSRCSSNCLKDYRQSTNTRPVDTYCNGYQGASNETAARIIEKTARSCGINPQVLLVLLEKEQTLITHASPSSTRYTIATGYACPDTAACDTRYYGFHNQVYSAARQFKIYAEGRYFTYFAPGRTWNIRWHPEASCGSAPVFIENKATAALYYYTPYQPNAAALRAGPGGTGDACSAYGNRNFSRFFNQWFGTPTVSTHGGIASVWLANGGAGGRIGGPVDEMVWDVANGGGWYQRFQNGTIYHTTSGISSVLYTSSGIHSRFRESGGVGGPLGWPTGDESCSDAACAVTFQHSTLAWSSSTRQIVQLVREIEDRWLETGGVDSWLGAPKAVEYWIPENGGGIAQEFEGGVVYRTAGGVMTSFGNWSGIFKRYLAANGPKGGMGWPRAGETCVTAGCMVPFDRAALSWDAASGRIHETNGRFANEWVAGGGPAHWAGPAVADMVATDGGWKQDFRNGTFYLKNGGEFVGWGSWSPLQREYLRRGAQGGALGWPTTGDACSAAGCVVTFERGNLVQESSTGRISSVHPSLFSSWREAGGLTGAIGAPTAESTNAAGGSTQQFRGGVGYVQQGAQGHLLRSGTALTGRYAQLGGPTGSLGWPTSTEVCENGVGCMISFERGTLTWDLGTRQTVLVPKELAEAWSAEGSLKHWIGPAKSDAVRAAGGWRQEFRNGTLYRQDGRSAIGWSTSSPLRQEYVRRGGESGPLGWPTSGDACSAGGCVVTFERGNLVRDGQNGVIAMVDPKMFDAWRQGGGTSGPLGAPSGAAASVPGGAQQDFRHAYAYAKDGAALFSYHRGSGLANTYRQRGGPSSDLGWPVSSEECDWGVGECVIRFERGSLIWSAATQQIRRG